MSKTDIAQPVSLDKRAILAAFGDRVFMKPEPKIEKKYLNLSPHLTREQLVPEDVSERYEICRLGAENITPIERDADFLWRYKKSTEGVKMLAKRSLGGAHPIDLRILKRMHAGELQDGMRFETDSWNLQVMDSAVPDQPENRSDFYPSNMASFTMHRTEDGNYALTHRFTRPEFRDPQNEDGETLGDIGLAACEQVVGQQAMRERQDKILEVDAGQLNVMLWLYRNRFKPKTAQDQEIFDAICNADPDLCVGHNEYIFKLDRYRQNIGRYDIDRQLGDYRVVFIKTIQPSASPMPPDNFDEQTARAKDAGKAADIRSALENQSIETRIRIN